MLNICLPLSPLSGRPLYLQLYEQLKADIIHGELPSEGKLPSIRELAKALAISKTTVEKAYEQLEMEGYIRAEEKVGYFVCILSNAAWHQPYKMEITPSFAAKEKIKYDFSNDYIDSQSFDFGLWRKYVNQSLQEDQGYFFDYGDPQGAYELRAQLAHYLRQSRRVACEPEQVIIGAGTQVLLNLLCGLVKKRYDKIGFEEPGFRYGRYVFQDQRFNIVPIPLEADGLSVTELKKSQVDMVYVSPSNQYPTGAVMSIQKRLELLEWIAQRDGLIIEDDYDSELRYFGRPIPSLQGLDSSGSVIYLGSFSKILLPALRISYLVLPPKLLAVLAEKISFYNQTASLIEQLTLARFMADGQLDKHIRKTRKIYAKKNQLLLDRLQEKMGEKIRILGKETGLHILLEVKSSKNAETLVAEAQEVGIAMTPLESYALHQPQSHAHPLVIMGYGGIPLAQITPAIDLLVKRWFG